MLKRTHRTLSLLSALAVGLLLGATAQAAPIADVLSGTDGNFRFSVVHTSTGCSDGQCGSILGEVSLGAGGGNWLSDGTNAFLDLELDVNVGGSISTYNAKGAFSETALTDFGTQADVLLGSLDVTLLSGADDAGLDGLTFLFEDRNYSTAANPPNGLTGNMLTLWGATAYTGTPTLGSALDLVPGGIGIDLRVEIGPPIPEPSAKPLFLAGIAVVAFGASRMRRSA